jgi:hypothetical protein
MGKYLNCWFLKLIRDTLCGFLILSTSLWVIGFACPPVYNFLTQWANYPKLPDLTECKIINKLERPSPNTEAYTVSIKIGDKKDGIYDVIFAAQDAYVSIYEVGTSTEIFQDDRNFLAKRFISKEGYREVEFKFDISVNHFQQGSQQFNIGNLSNEECPIEVFPLKRKK